MEVQKIKTYFLFKIIVTLQLNSKLGIHHEIFII